MRMAAAKSTDCRMGVANAKFFLGSSTVVMIVVMMIKILKGLLLAIIATGNVNTIFQPLNLLKITIPFEKR
jgi:hypothetical protein